MRLPYWAWGAVPLATIAGMFLLPPTHQAVSQSSGVVSCMYDASQDTYTDQQFAPCQADANGNIRVTSAGVTQGTTIDGTITRIADHAAYTADDVVSDSTSAPTVGGFTLSNACRQSGGTGIITDIYITDSDDSTTDLAGVLYIFDQAVTAVNDNAAFAITDAEARTLVTRQTFTVTDIGAQNQASIEDLAISYKCVGTANLRFLLQASNAYDPAANSGVIQIRVKVLYTS